MEELAEEGCPGEAVDGAGEGEDEPDETKPGEDGDGDEDETPDTAGEVVVAGFAGAGPSSSGREAGDEGAGEAGAVSRDGRDCISRCRAYALLSTRISRYSSRPKSAAGMMVAWVARP